MPQRANIRMGQVGKGIYREQLPDGLRAVSTPLPVDYPLHTWDDALNDGHYEVYLTVPQAGLPAGIYYLDVQRHSGDTKASQFRKITATSIGAGNVGNQIYSSTCANGIWTSFRRIAVDEPLTWITPTLLNGWSFLNQAKKSGYSKSSSGIVFVSIVVNNGSNTLNSTIFNMPIGYRPATLRINICYISAGFCRTDVDINGNVNLIGFEPHLGNATSYSAIEFSFKAEQ